MTTSISSKLQGIWPPSSRSPNTQLGKEAREAANRPGTHMCAACEGCQVPRPWHICRAPWAVTAETTAPDVGGPSVPRALWALTPGAPDTQACTHFTCGG